MKIINSKSLVEHNTFKININAKLFVTIKSEDELFSLLNQKRLQQKNKFILGGGSNILFTKNMNCLVIHNQIKGIKVDKETDSTITLSIGAGECWDNVVQWTTDRNLYGIENLSLIPGYIGAAPIQNIGAYGVEFQDVFVKLKAINLKSKEIYYFNKLDCQFGYRDSIFKNSLKGKLIITNIKIKLSKKKRFILSYKALQNKIRNLDIKQLNSQDIRQIIINIRNSKLPNPKAIGNAGSFFKNPIVNNKTVKSIQKSHPQLPIFQSKEEIKIPAGWLIEQLKWKGYKEKECGIYHKHSLVLINHGNATGQEIVNLSQRIKEDVLKEFNIKLEEEVLIL